MPRSLKFSLKNTAPFLLGMLTFSTLSVAQTSLLENNLELSSLNSKIENLKLDKKIINSAFLPELSLNGGLGSEKLRDDSYETKKGPYVFIESKLNLYRGGRDSIAQDNTQTKITIAKIEKEIKTRNLNIEAFKLISQIELMTKENKLIEDEILDNATHHSMARKKVDAGLTTSVDLLDFELKRENLSNELDKNLLTIDILKKELVNLFAGSFSYSELEKTLSGQKTNASTPIESSLQDTPNLMLAQKQIDLNNSELSAIKREYLPSVELEAKWGQITPQEKFLDSKKEHAVLLNIHIPLFSGLSTSGKIQQSVNESTLKKRELKQTEIETVAQRDLESKKIELSKRILASLQRTQAQSIRYKNLTIGEYKRGVKNSPDVISASDNLLEIERKLLETQTELLISTYSFNQTFKPYSGE